MVDFFTRGGGRHQFPFNSLTPKSILEKPGRGTRDGGQGEKKEIFNMMSLRLKCSQFFLFCE